MEIKTKDEIVLKVLRKMDQRSIVGQQKYGATMMEEIEGQKKDLNRFLVDVQEELMDALLYIESAKRCLADEVEDLMLKNYSYEEEKRMNVIGQNGNDGLHYDEDHSLDMVLNDIVKDIDVNEETIL
jgi:hypothetical protein